MTKYLLVALLIALPASSYAEDETPTPEATATTTATATATATPTVTPTVTNTPTITPTRTPGIISNHGQATDELFSVPMVVVEATAMPTTFSTPQIPGGLPLKALEVINTLNQDVLCILGGGGLTTHKIPTGTKWEPPLAEMKLHTSHGVTCRAENTCSSGELSISASY